MEEVRDVLFISDLHLSPEQPGTGRLFLRFLREHAVHARALYILGDLFEAWLGDDAILPAYQPFIDGLRDLTRGGVSLHVMRGNRDFLLGERFSSLTGASLLEDPTVVTLSGKSTLLMHGDLLCTDDATYQRFRTMVHDPAWQEDLFRKPMAERLELARQLREESRLATGRKSEAIMDVNQQTVEETMRRHRTAWLIHGHTHRPAQHDFSLDGGRAIRFVLPEWTPRQGGGLRYHTPDSPPHFESYPP